MIISDKILYLRKKTGYTQEELADKLNVSRQSISKWESAQSIPDVSKIKEMAKIFSVSTDYLLDDEIEQLDGEVSVDINELQKVITIEEVNEYIKSKDKSLRLVAIGVLLFIISAIPLIASSCFTKDNEPIIAVGVVALLVLVTIGVGLCIYSGVMLLDYKYIEEGKFQLSYNVDGIIKDQRNKFKKKRTIRLIVCVSAIILSIAPIIITSLVDKNDNAMIISVCVLLFIVANAVSHLIINEGKWDCYKRLLFEGDYASSNKLKSDIEGIYWCIATVIYLGWSFITNDWHITWVVWPIAGTLSGVIDLVISLRRNRSI